MRLDSLPRPRYTPSSVGPVRDRSAMSPTPLRVLFIVALATGTAAAQPGPPPVAVLGEPAPRLPLIDLNDPLGPPDQPFRPFAPLGPPPALAEEGIGSRFGLGL